MEELSRLRIEVLYQPLLHLKQVILGKPMRRNLHLPFRADKKQCGYIDQSVLLRCFVRLFIDQDRKADAEVLRKALAVAYGVLGNTPDLQGLSPKLLVQSFDERQSELACGTSHLEERSEQRSSHQRFGEGVKLAVHAHELESRRALSDGHRPYRSSASNQGSVSCFTESVQASAAIRGASPAPRSGPGPIRSKTGERS